MAADEAGNDVSAVGIAVSGFLGVAPFGTPIPTSVEGADPDLELNVAFRKIGLVKKGAGPQMAWSSTGDPIDFWQDGYSEPSGLAEVSLTFTAAEALNDVVNELISGEAADANGYTEIDGGGHSEKYVFFTEEIFKNGAIRRRALPNCSVKSTTEDQNNRGEVVGTQFVIKIDRSEDAGGKHFGQWILPAEDGS